MGSVVIKNIVAAGITAIMARNNGIMRDVVIPGLGYGAFPPGKI